MRPHSWFAFVLALVTFVSTGGIFRTAWRGPRRRWGMAPPLSSDLGLPNTYGQLFGGPGLVVGPSGSNYPITSTAAAGGAEAVLAKASTALKVTGGTLYLVGGGTTTYYLEATWTIPYNVSVICDGCTLQIWTGTGFSPIVQSDPNTQSNNTTYSNLIIQGSGTSLTSLGNSNETGFLANANQFCNWDVSVILCNGSGAVGFLGQTTTLGHFQGNVGNIVTQKCASGIQFAGTSSAQADNNSWQMLYCVNCGTTNGGVGIDFHQYTDHNVTQWAQVLNNTSGTTGFVGVRFNASSSTAQSVNHNTIFEMGFTMSGADTTSTGVIDNGTANVIVYGDALSIFNTKISLGTQSDQFLYIDYATPTYYVGSAQGITFQYPSLIYGGNDNRKGLTGADASATTLYTAPAAGHLIRLTAQLTGTAGTISSAVYTITYVENSHTFTLTLTISAVDTLAVGNWLIQPDNGSTITVQLTTLSGTGTPKVNVAAVTEVIA